MSFWGDMRVIWGMAFHRGSSTDLKSRLEEFYSGQSADYDSFRKKLLHGRESLMSEIGQRLEPGATLLDMGGGTGNNIAELGPHLAKLGRVDIIDLCSPLLGVAQARIKKEGWTNVQTIEADATKFVPPLGPVDAITFSYSLSMIPDWFLALERALENLKPGGIIGVVDFYISRKWPEPKYKKHSTFSRGLWPLWFANDNVFPSQDHLPWLASHSDPIMMEEGMGKIPYVPVLRAPYYIFLGRKSS